jgi:hypothetical protein
MSKENENADFRSKYWRLVTFSLGLILIYQLIPDKIETIYFWLLLICYTIGAAITWIDECKNNLFKIIIIFIIDGIISSLILPGLNLGNDIQKLLIIVFITAYFIGSLYATLICEFIFFIYRSYIKMRMPARVQYNIDKLIQFVSCLSPFGLLIYLGSSLMVLPRVESVSRPIELSLSELENISHFLVEFKSSASSLLPTAVNDLLSQIQHRITPLIIDPLMQYIPIDKIIFLFILVILMIISVYIQIFIEKRIQEIKDRCIEACKIYLHIPYTYVNLIYNLFLIYLIIYFSIYGITNYDSFLFYIALFPIIIYFAVKTSNYFNMHVYFLLLEKWIQNILKGFSKKIKNERNSDIFILLDVSESMASNKKIEYAKTEIIKTLKNLENSGNKIGLITFGGADLIEVYDLRDLRENYSELIDIIKNIKVEGTTPILSAIKCAYEKLKNTDLERSKFIYIITDGHPTDYRGIVPELEDEILEYIKNYMKDCEIKITGVDAICKNYFLKQIEKLSKTKAS